MPVPRARHPPARPTPWEAPVRISGSKLRRPAVGLAAVGLLVGTAVVATPANAAPESAAAVTPADAALLRTSALATTLGRTLGATSAGSYLDATGALVVTVTDAAAADTVAAAGATPRLVTRSAATLAKADATLRSTLKTPGTSFNVDPVSNQVLVTYDQSVTGAALAEVRAVVARLGDAARLEATPGTLSTTITGGDAIYGGGSRCSLGFNAGGGGIAYFVTAGHCGNLASTWTLADGTPLGTRVISRFPGDDYAVFRYTNTGVSRPGAVNLYNGSLRDITTSGNAVVGLSVARSGSTTGLRSGTVLGLNATVNYREGSVSGLIRTNVCAEGGDSGGSLFSGSTALGLTSGGSGNCRTGGITYFQPVTEALAAAGIQVY